MKKQQASGNGPVAAFAFQVLSVLMSPISVLGYIIWIGRGAIGGSAQGVSATAQGPLAARWSEHNLGTRKDEAANRLMTVVPGVPPLAVKLTSEPTLLAHRLTGYVPKAFRYPFEGEVPPQYEASAHIDFFDSALEEYLPKVAQFVILGAGFDTRPYGLPKDSGVRAFEVDMPNTQAVKRQMLEKAGIDASRVTFVGADFEKEDWMAKLVQTGFDPRKPSFFLWEGVTMYLEQGVIQETLRKIAGTGKGSAVPFDHFSSEALTSQAIYWRYGRYMTKLVKEPLQFGIDSTPPLRDRVAEFVATCGLTLVQQRTLGEETDGKRAWGGFAVAEVR